MDFAEFKKKMSSSLLSWIFFKFLAFIRPVLIVCYLQIRQTKTRWIIQVLISHFLRYSKSRDL